MLIRLLTVIIALLQSAIPGAPGNIEGTVCEVETCRPIAGARLMILSVPGSPEVRKTAVTDLAGRFRFPQLQPGSYRISLEADNYSLATVLPLLTLIDGAIIPGVKIEMRALAVISGRAFDEKGQPLAGAHVEAMAFYRQGAYRMLSPVGGTETDDRGEYRISSLEPDDYYIRVLPRIDRLAEKPFPATYYPNTTDPAMAAKITLTRGAEASGIDPQLSSRGVKVRGRVINPSKEKTRLLVLLLPRASVVSVLPDFNPNTTEETEDDFELGGVAPGSYYLYVIRRADPQVTGGWVRRPVDVGDIDVENIAVPLLPLGTIKGRVIIASDAIDGDALDLSRITLHAGTTEVVPGAPRMTGQAQVAKNGAIEARPTSEMKMFLSDQILADSWFISAVRLDGNDVMNDGFSASPGKDSILEVVISNAGGTLAGVVKDRQDQPVPAGRIALLPEHSRRNNPYLVRTGVAIEKGEYTIETIPPGEYTAIGFPDEEQFTPAFLRDLQSVEKYERYGQPVHIGATAVTRLDLTVAPANAQ